MEDKTILMTYKYKTYFKFMREKISFSRSKKELASYKKKIVNNFILIIRLINENKKYNDFI